MQHKIFVGNLIKSMDVKTRMYLSTLYVSSFNPPYNFTIFGSPNLDVSLHRDLSKARNPSGLLVVKLGDIQLLGNATISGNSVCWMRFGSHRNLSLSLVGKPMGLTETMKENT